jgi:hypothetical protein
MRNAIDGIEGALCGLGSEGEIEGASYFRDLIDVFDTSPDAIKIMIRCNIGQLKCLVTAFDECNRIINSEDYSLK